MGMPFEFGVVRVRVLERKNTRTLPTTTPKK